MRGKGEGKEGEETACFPVTPQPLHSR